MKSTTSGSTDMRVVNEIVVDCGYGGIVWMYFGISIYTDSTANSMVRTSGMPHTHRIP
jgi:hypothetical protein